MLYLLILFVVVPFVELVLLLWLADQTSWQFTVLLVLVTGVIGSIAARRQGLGIWIRVQRQMQAGELPGAAIFDGVLVLISGALLITPGMLTDAVGFALLVPFIRRRVRGRLMKWFISRSELRVRMFRQSGGVAQDDGTPCSEDGTFDSHAVEPVDDHDLGEGDSGEGDAADRPGGSLLP